MIKVAVVGASGYAGQELIRLLYQHPNVDIKVITSRSNINERYDSMYGNYIKRSNLTFEVNDVDKICKDVDIIFLALPHGVASNIVTKDIISKAKIIDLGADFRISDLSIYENWYNTKHGNETLLKEDSIYGLCELNRENIGKYKLIANPGCYTTCSILSLAPIMDKSFIDKKSLIIDAKSGVTGAGRSLDISTHFTECNESIKAYKVASHRHTPEIEEQLSVIAGEDIHLIFTPHLVPMNRGILATCYIRLTEDIHIDDIYNIYREFYKDDYFVRLLNKGINPETKWVKGSNYCDIGINLDSRTNTLIVVGAIDNLIKGAAGQAVQNMNILFGLDETTGLEDIAIFPV
ncbi:N-acetyl-gamma-glutamyl-phosphate reductase [Alkalibaculum sp. M08DMB]|uniref:N-acetyl-gamma-glutamyl-phosphate reductase n=1 Tax=Alkalibaculum sporogenes TaxID=2655001 RepID=A0A6A7KBS3_9FIRM|nr:N-acetyl-gamma-glutamyl-phosphate reductase [Alkalibaculum sporogenes]MPW26637.1 N-acetyl-gamma-glutamyl-phosphate reductase [Alkalibaculum sporogenes]